MTPPILHRSRVVRSILLSLLFLLPGTGKAEDHSSSFEHLPSSLLSHVHVTALHQDRLGFMWIGTQGGGLHRYDGYDAVLYDHDPRDSTSLASNNITDIFEDDEGTLWVTTWAGLSRYHRDRDGFENWSNSDGSGLLG